MKSVVFGLLKVQASCDKMKLSCNEKDLEKSNNLLKQLNDEYQEAEGYLKRLLKNNIYHRLRPETLYLFFACNNKNFLGKSDRREQLFTRT